MPVLPISTQIVLRDALLHALGGEGEPQACCLLLGSLVDAQTLSPRATKVKVLLLYFD